MTSFMEELDILKSDFSYLKEKILSIELRIKQMESKMPPLKSDAPVPMSSSDHFMQVKERYQFENSTLHTLPSADHHGLDKKTRNIIEELMWESTLSKAVLQVRETFKDDYSREMFLRCSLEMVLEKDEQYRKMIGTLFGHLLNENVINQSSVFNSLCSVLMVIENSSNCDTKMWQNLTEILLPIITDSHIKMLQLQRRAQAILKQEYYQEFINYLAKGLELVRKRKNFRHFSLDSSTYVRPSKSGRPQIEVELPFPANSITKDMKCDSAGEVAAKYVNRNENQITCDFGSISEHKVATLEIETANCRVEVERLFSDLVIDENLEDAIRKVKKLQITYDTNAIIEELINIGVQKEPVAVGNLLVEMISCNFVNIKEILTIFCKQVNSVEKLVLNPKTRTDICGAFAEMFSPLIAAKKTNVNQLAAVASSQLSEETHTIFIWLLEKKLNDAGIKNLCSHPQPSDRFKNKILTQSQKYIEKNEQPENNDVIECDLSKRKVTVVPYVRNENLFDDRSEQRNEQEKNRIPEISQHETYLLLKRKKLLKERIENMGDRSDIKIESLLDQTVKKVDIEAGDTQAKLDVSKPELEQPPPKQPENLPSSAIKEKMEEVIEHLMSTGNTDECVTIIRDTFNECQTDLVFKAAFEYTREKSSDYKMQAGLLIAEAFKHDSKRIGAQIMNTISLELGDFVDSPHLWKGMAEIICPSILNGLIRFSDLKLLPKYFKHTPYCASLLSALFKEIIHHKGPEWLEENWKKSKFELTTFLADDLVYTFVTDNDLGFILKNNDSAVPLREDVSDT